MTGFELMHVSSMMCSLVTFLLNVVLNLAAWLIVLTTVDRFVAVWLPLQAAAVCRRRRARVAVLALVLIAAAASGHLFWTTGLYQSGGGKWLYCGPAPDSYFMRLSHQFEYIKLASYSLVPFAIILGLNVAIVVRLRCSRPAAGILQRGISGVYGGGGVGDGGQQQQSAVTSRLTYMLLAVSLTWLVLSTPFALHMLVGGALLDVNDDLSRARYRLIRTVCFQLMYANHAVNFFLYCVTGRKFRHELRDVYVELCCWCRVSDDRRRRYGEHCLAAGDGSSAECGNRMIELDESPAAAESTPRRSGHHEMAVITTCRSTHRSVLVAQSGAVGRCANTSP